MARNAAIEAQNAPTYKARSNNVAPEWERVEGVQVSDLPASRTKDYDDQSIWNLLYHAYDGRVVPIPASFTKIRLEETFPFEQYIPAEWRGKPVWYTSPDEVQRPKVRNAICPLSDRADEETKADVEAMGYAVGSCTKMGIGNIVEHIRRKHRNFNADYKEYTARKEQKRQADAFLALAESLTKDK